MKIDYFVSKFLKKIHLPAIKNSEIHHTSKVASYSHLVRVKIERYSYVGNNCTVVDAEIGRFCSIADNVIIGGASHPVHWVSTSPVFHEGANIMKKNFSTHPFKTTERTTIRNDVWIGNNSLIKSGVNINNGAVIGMGSVVTKDVGEYEVWGGNPARCIRKRFNDEIIQRLIDSEWWYWSDDEILKNSKFMSDVEIFLKELSLRNP